MLHLKQSSDLDLGVPVTLHQLLKHVYSTVFLYIHVFYEDYHLGRWSEEAQKEINLLIIVLLDFAFNN